MAKINVAQHYRLEFSTYLGGKLDDGSGGVAIGPTGDAYVTGFTRSSNFPTTPGSYHPTLSGYMNGFVTRLGQDRPVVFVPGVAASHLGLAPDGASGDWLGDPATNHGLLALRPESANGRHRCDQQGAGHRRLWPLPDRDAGGRLPPTS